MSTTRLSLLPNPHPQQPHLLAASLPPLPPLVVGAQALPRQVLLELPGMTPQAVDAMETALRSSTDNKRQKDAIRDLLRHCADVAAQVEGQQLAAQQLAAQQLGAGGSGGGGLSQRAAREESALRCREPAVLSAAVMAVPGMVGPAGGPSFAAQQASAANAAAGDAALSGLASLFGGE